MAGKKQARIKDKLREFVASLNLEDPETEREVKQALRSVLKSTHADYDKRSLEVE